MLRSSLVPLLAGALCATPPASAQSNDAPLRLVVEEGTPLRVALDRRAVIRRVGQQVEAVLVDPIFAYDRIVIPIGTRVLGHVERRTAVAKKRRALAMLSGDFTPLHDILLQFDAIVLAEGRRLPVRTQVAAGTEQVTLKLADGAQKKGNIVSSAGEEAVQQAKQTVAILKGPDKVERMKDTGLRALPYHPEFFSKGTVFNARLLSALDFGSAAPAETADAGTAPAPESVLSARLVTAIDSSHATRGTPVEAVVTRPVFSSTQQLILPAGTRLTGQVTFVKRARHFRRNGQLRFLFDTVHVRGRDSTGLLASLYSVQAGRAERLAVDEEGGTKVTNSPTRFIAPAVGALALVGLSRSHLDYDTDGLGPETEYGGPLSGSVAGFVGASITGLALSSLGHPAAVTLGVLGVVRTTYAGVIAKGREVVFPADTRIQVQLAPRAPAPKQGPSVRRAELQFGLNVPVLAELKLGPTSAMTKKETSRSDVWQCAAVLAVAVSVVVGVAAEPPATFRAETRLVVLHVLVTNGHGELVTNLDRGAFSVDEDGRRQSITLFRRDDVPASLGLIIDNSGSMRSVRASVEAAALAFVHASNPLDEVFVVNFADKPRIDVPFTNDVHVLEAGISRVDSIGGTAMRDAILIAERYLRDRATRDRRALLVITDGNDNASTVSRAQLRKVVEQGGSVIYAVRLVGQSSSEEDRSGDGELDHLTALAGGDVHYVASMTDVDSAVLEIAHQIRNEYTIAYTPANQALDGSYRAVRVKVTRPGGLNARTRPGYWATPPAVMR